MKFRWDEIQYRPDGKVLLLWRHERIFDEGLTSPGGLALDIGGWGHLASRIEQEGMHCIIVDTFGEDQYFPDRVRSMRYVHGDILSDLFDAEDYMLITCFEMLEHCIDQRKAIHLVHKYLKPYGWFVGSIPIEGFCHFKDEKDVIIMDEETITKYLEEAGFANILVEPTPSINKDDKVCPSLYFKAMKRNL